MMADVWKLKRIERGTHGNGKIARGTGGRLTFLLRTPHFEKSVISRSYVSFSWSVESGRIWHDTSVSGSTWRSSAKIGYPLKPSGLRSLAAIVSLVIVRPWCLWVSTPLLVPKVHCTSETENPQQNVQEVCMNARYCKCTISRPGP